MQRQGRRARTIARRCQTGLEGPARGSLNMADSDSRLIAGEEIVFRTSKHWLAPIADSWKAVLLIIGSLVLAWLQTEQTDGLIGFGNRVLGILETVLMLGGVLLIVYNLFTWRSAKYMVTNMRVLGQDGLAHKRETDS